MKKFLKYTSIFLAMILVIDLFAGKLFNYIEAGSDSKNYHCRYKAKEDILVLGSSYAVRSIDPEVIENKTDLTCYNAGEAGNGIVAAWARYNFFIQCKTPKIILYTCTSAFDYLATDDYSKYYSILKPCADDSIVRQIFVDLGAESELYQLESNFVKFNSKWITMLKDNLIKKVTKGFDPLYTKLDTTTVTPSNNDVESFKIDTVKLNILERFYSSVHNKDIPIICVYTPLYADKYITDYNNINDSLCKKYNIPILDYTNDDRLCKHAELFCDKHRLNKDGAEIFTTILSQDIKTLISKYNIK